MIYDSFDAQSGNLILVEPTMPTTRTPTLMTSTGAPRVPAKEADDWAVPFDDCLRVLVNTPPKPKKAEKQAEPKKAQETPK